MPDKKPESVDVTDCCSEIADEVVGAFSGLYPKLKLPFDVWQTLNEMIMRECVAHLDEGHPVEDGANAIAASEPYKLAAMASGLR